MKSIYSLVVVLWLALVVSPVVATDYYIESQADFDNLKQATFSAGDNIFFQKGKRFKGMFAPKGKGEKGAPIRIGSIGKGDRPRIDVQGKEQAGIFLQNPSFWEVDGLEITNTNGSDEDQGQLFGIRVLATVDKGRKHKWDKMDRREKRRRREESEGVFEHVYITNCYIHDINGKVAGKRRGGIHVHMAGLKKSIFHDLRITNNRVENVGGVGIGNDSQAAEIIFHENSYETKNLWTDVYVADNFIDRTGRNGIIARASKDAIYECNIVANSSRYDTGHSIFCFATDGIKIQYNEAYGNVGEGNKDRGGFDGDYSCVNTFIQYNYSHDNLWFCGIMKRSNRHVVIRYNLSVNDHKGIYFYGFNSNVESEDIHIYNNTHFISKKYQACVFPNGRTPINSLFENNVFYFEGGGTWGKEKTGPGVKFHNNKYVGITPHPSDSSPVEGRLRFRSPGKTPQDIDLRSMKELLGYRLRKKSAGIEAGKKIKDSGGLTFEKKKVSLTKPHIGALGSK